MPDLTNASPSDQSSVSPSQGPESSVNGNIQSGGEARQSATATETFVPQGMNVNTLPPAVRAEMERVNNEMVRGFTAKTQKLAEEAKKYEGYDAFKQKAEFYDQFSAQDEFVKRWNDYVEEVNARKNGVQKADSSDPVHAKLAEFEKQLQAERLARQESEVMTFVDAFSNAKDEKGAPLHPDFEALSEYTLGASKEAGEYSLLRACIELAGGNTPQERVSAGYKIAKGIRDQLLEEGRKQGMGRMLSKVRNSTEAPTISSDKTSFNGDAKKLSVREARELAEKGVVVR